MAKKETTKTGRNTSWSYTIFGTTLQTQHTLRSTNADFLSSFCNKPHTQGSSLAESARKQEKPLKIPVMLN